MRTPRILSDARRFEEIRSDAGQLITVEEAAGALLRLGIVPVGSAAVHETHVSFDVVGQRIDIEHGP